MKHLNNILKHQGVETNAFWIHKHVYSCLLMFFMAIGSSFAQDVEAQLSESNDYVFEGNSIVDTDFIEAEKNTV